MERLKLGDGRLPSLDTVPLQDLRRRVKNMRSMDFGRFTQAQVYSRLELLLDCFPFPLSDVRFNGCFRARINNGEDSFENADQLWYPPADKITRRGRLNDIGRSRFYCASEPHTATFEVRPNPGDLVTLLLARARVPWVSLSTSFVGVARSLNADVRATRDEAVMQRRQLSNLGRSAYAKFKMIDDLLTEFITEVVEDERRYMPTIALAELLLDGAGIDAIHYPSVSTQYNGVNMVMAPEKADAFFQPEEAWEIYFDGYYQHPAWPEPQMGLRPVRRSAKITKDGRIYWMPVGFGTSSAEFGRFVQIQDVKLSPEQMPTKVENR